MEEIMINAIKDQRNDIFDTQHLGYLRKQCGGKYMIQYAIDFQNLYVYERIVFLEFDLLLENDKTMLMYLVQRDVQLKVGLYLKPLASLLRHTDKFGNSALHFAILNSNPQYYEFLQSEHDIINQHQISPMAHAIFLQNLQAIQFLKRFKHDFMAPEDRTVLMLAIVQKCSSQIISELLDSQAIRQCSPNNRIFRYAVNLLELYQFEESLMDRLFDLEVDLLLEENQSTPLMFAVRFNLRNKVQQYLNCAGQVDVRGQSALMFAAIHGYLDYCKLLISRETKLVDSLGNTALIRAIVNDQQEIAIFLSDHEAGVGQQTYHSKHTALSYSMLYGNEALVAKLFDKEKDISMVEGKPIVCCIRQNHSAIFRAYHQYYLNQPVTPDGKSMLQYACFVKQPNYVEFVFDTEKNFVSENGFTTLMAVAQANFVQYFPQIQNQVNLLTTNNENALHFAADFGSFGMFDILYKLESDADHESLRMLFQHAYSELHKQFVYNHIMRQNLFDLRFELQNFDRYYHLFKQYFSSFQPNFDDVLMFQNYHHYLYFHYNELITCTQKTAFECNKEIWDYNWKWLIQQSYRINPGECLREVLFRQFVEIEDDF